MSQVYRSRNIFSFFLFLYVYAHFSYAQVAPQNILLEKCMFSYSKTYKHLKKNKAFAYARVAVGEEDHCVWTQAQHDVQSAQSIALKACNEKGLSTKCKIVDVNDAWRVNEGDFSIIMPADHTALTVQKEVSLIAEVEKLVLGECLSLFKNHLKEKGHKVFAYSIDEDGRFACATSKEHQTLRKAALVALEVCEETKKSLKNMAPTSKCLALSDGRNILLGVKEYNLTIDTKPNIFLNKEAYQHYVEQAKKMLFGACLEQYKYYIRNKDHKAFYIAKDTKENLVCGLSFDKFTINSAKKHAFKKCENAAKRKNISSKCQLFSLNLD